MYQLHLLPVQWVVLEFILVPNFLLSDVEVSKVLQQVLGVLCIKFEPLCHFVGAGIGRV